MAGLLETERKSHSDSITLCVDSVTCTRSLVYKGWPIRDGFGDYVVIFLKKIRDED